MWTRHLLGGCAANACARLRSVWRLIELLALHHHLHGLEYPAHDNSNDGGDDGGDDDDCSLGHFQPYASPEQLANDSLANPLRPDGYGLLGQPMLHSMALSSAAKAYRYSSNPGLLDVPQ